MPAVHVTTIQAVAFTTATDLFECTVTTDKSVEIMEMSLFQTTDLGDAQEEVLAIQLLRGATAGATGTALTENPLNGGDSASSLAVVTNRGTASTSGTEIDRFGWNIRIPLLWCPIPELRPIVSATTDVLTFKLVAAPTDSITISGALKWRELY